MDLSPGAPKGIPAIVAGPTDTDSLEDTERDYLRNGKVAGTSGGRGPLRGKKEGRKAAKKK